MGDRLTTAVLIEDHEVARDGIRLWCSQAEPRIELLAAGDRVALAWTEPGCRADVVILDLEVEGKRQYDAVSRLAESGRRVVVYTMYTSDEAAMQCIDRGALAYVTKAEGKEHLIAAVRAAADGLPYTPPSLSGAMLVDPKRPKLSPKEMGALRAWFGSKSKALAASRMFVTESTLDEYIQRVRVKYANVGRSAPTKADLVIRALKDGWMNIEDLEE